MRKKIFLGMILAMSFLSAGCNRSVMPSDNEYHSEVDFPYQFRDGFMGLGMTSSETGYYLLHNNLIYYMDKEKMKPVILDNRPDNNCLSKPDSKNCYAFVKNEEQMTSLLQYYHSHLYIAESLFDPKISKFGWYMKLSRMDSDGKNRHEIKTFKLSPKTIAIHRGYIYYATVSVTKDNVEQLEIKRSKLKDPNKEEIIYTGTDGITDLSAMIPFGNQLYWVGLGNKGYAEQRYDFSTGKVTTLWDRGDGGYSSILSISDQRLYFSYFYGDPADPRTLKKYSSDLQGRDIKELPIEHPPVISYFLKDNNYSYIRPNDAYKDHLPKGVPYELAILKDNVKIDSLDLTPLTKFFQLYVGDDRYMFIRYSDDTKAGYYYIDKSQFETKQASFKPLLESKVENESLVD